MRVFSVETKEINEGMFDNFSGTYEDCIKWCKDNSYHNWNENNGARICEIEADENGCFTYCYNEIEEWEEKPQKSMLEKEFIDYLRSEGYEDLEDVESIEEFEWLSHDYLDWIWICGLKLNEYITVENDLAGWEELKIFDYEKHNELFEKEAEEEFGFVPEELPDVFNENEDAVFSTRWLTYNKVKNHSKYYSNFEEFIGNDCSIVIDDAMCNNFHGSPTLKEANESVIKVIDEYTKLQRN